MILKKPPLNENMGRNQFPLNHNTQVGKNQNSLELMSFKYENSLMDEINYLESKTKMNTA